MAGRRPGTIASRAIPIGAVIGDQQSALYGQGGFSAGDSKATYGTGAFLLKTREQIVPSKNRLVTTTALAPAGESAYALEGRCSSRGGGAMAS